MRLVVALVLGVFAAYGQSCAPVSILPAGTVSGTLDGSSCLLSDGTAYNGYRLDLATRGQIRIDFRPVSSDLIVILRDGTGAQVDAGLSMARALEAGSYTVVVNGHVPGQVGAYSLQTAFTAEPGMLCSAFPSLGLSQTVAGRLGVSGCAKFSGAPYDGYWLNTFGAGTLTVSIATSDFTPTLTVRTGEGWLIGSGDGSVSVPVDAASRYEVVVASGDTAGAYQLTTDFQPDDTETCRMTKALSAPGGDNGAITGDSCATPVTAAGDVSLYNYYRLSVSAAGVADITASSTDFAPSLVLLDDSGNAIASGGPEIRMQLAPGNYTVQLLSSVVAGGAYQLGYSFTEGAPQPCAPSALAAGDAPAGTLAPASCRTDLGPADLYSITLPGPGTLEVTLSAASFGGLAAIRDGKDNLVVAKADLEQLGVTVLSADLPAGTYTIAAGSAAGAGDYVVSAKFTAHELAKCGAPQTLDINGGYIQKLGAGSCRGTNGQPVDYYEFTLPSDGVALAVMTSSEVDGYLTLTDTSGKALRSDDNSYFGADPLIVQYLPAGTYRLAARAAGSTIGGRYEVDVRSTLGPRPAFCGPVAKVAAGGSVTGTIGFSGCQYTDATFADIYQVDLTADTLVDLRLNSTAFDAYLVLLDADGNMVDQDDDSGGNTNSRITHQLAAGTYYVVAKPAAGYTSGGAYTLTVGQ